MTGTEETRIAVAMQIARLGAVEPLNDAKLGELTKVGLRRFDDIASLRFAVDGLLEDSKLEGVPSPAQFAALAPKRESSDCADCCNGWIEVRPGGHRCGCVEGGLLADCWKCHGAGFVEDESYTVSERCHCLMAKAVEA